MSNLRRIGTFEVKVGGVEFRLRRRSTVVMAQARGLMAVAGQIAGANAPVGEVDESKVADMYQSVLKVALLEVNDGGGWRPAAEFEWDEIAPFSDVLFEKFLASGLQVDPTPPSCAG